MREGTPSADCPSVLRSLLGLLQNGHPDSHSMIYSLGKAAPVLAGCTASPEESRYTIEALGILASSVGLFEQWLGRECYVDAGVCSAHCGALELLRILAPERWDWLIHQVVHQLREDPGIHAPLWETAAQMGNFDALSDGDLEYCFNNAPINNIRHITMLCLVSRGNQAAIAETRRSFHKLDNGAFAIGALVPIIRHPNQVPFDILMYCIQQATDLRVVSDLALTVLRKAANDQRLGWDVVSEQRLGQQLVVRHTAVCRPHSAIAEFGLEFYRNDLGRNPMLGRIDSDMWELFGLKSPFPSKPKGQMGTDRMIEREEMGSA